jgi:hypothetical protein
MLSKALHFGLAALALVRGTPSFPALLLSCGVDFATVGHP